MGQSAEWLTQSSCKHRDRLFSHSVCICGFLFLFPFLPWISELPIWLLHIPLCITRGLWSGAAAWLGEGGQYCGPETLANFPWGGWALLSASHPLLRGLALPRALPACADPSSPALPLLFHLFSLELGGDAAAEALVTKAVSPEGRHFQE